MVGAGVIGLTVAYELAAVGCRVTIVADHDASESVSGVAGALWFPYQIDSGAATQRSLTSSISRFHALSREPQSGVELRTGVLVEREPIRDRSWMAVITDHRPAEPAELPAGAPDGHRLTLPLIDTQRYLRWLARAGESQGVVRSRSTVQTLDELAPECDVVVVAAGLRSGELLGDDDSLYPVRGQVVRLANPGLRDWVVDEDNPAGLTYVFPRADDIVCGGTAEEGVFDLTWDSDIEQAILRRAIALVPDLANLPVVSRAVGLRPARPTVRLELLADRSVPVVTCYGHGGAGVSDSWGSAAAVRKIIASL